MDSSRLKFPKQRPMRKWKRSYTHSIKFGQIRSLPKLSGTFTTKQNPLKSLLKNWHQVNYFNLNLMKALKACKFRIEGQTSGPLLLPTRPANTLHQILRLDWEISETHVLCKEKLLISVGIRSCNAFLQLLGWEIISWTTIRGTQNRG